VNGDQLPMTGAEDFAYYLMEKEHGGKPGCFFFLGGFEEHLKNLSSAGVTNHEWFKAKSEAYMLDLIKTTVLKGDKLNQPGAFASTEANEMRRTNCICHGTAFDFNDNVIPNAMKIWLKIVEKRLGVSLYADEEVCPEVFASAVQKAVDALNKVGPSVQYS
jgi:metal-dependent amidase/aminoacylase/carboxypeptidase family protein